MPAFPLTFGVDTFGDLAFDGDGRALTQAETIRRVVDEGVVKHLEDPHHDLGGARSSDAD